MTRYWYTGPSDDRRRYRTDDPEGFLGSEGTVFEAEAAEQDQSPARVALKQLAAVTSDAAQEQIGRSKQLVQLDHPHIARHRETFLGPGLFEHDAPQTDNDVLYVATDWAPGTPLATLTKPPPPATALRLLEQLASAVQYLHDHGLAHRDLHPGNVIVDDDRLTVIDLVHGRPAGQAGFSHVFGASGFVPPERYDDPTTSAQTADRWQVAMLGVQLLLGRPRTRESLIELQAEVEGALAGTVPDPAGSARLLVAMLTERPAARPTLPLTAWSARVAGRHRIRSRRSVGVVAAGLVAAGLVAAGLVVAGAVAIPLIATGGRHGPGPGHTSGAPCRLAIGAADPAQQIPETALTEIRRLGSATADCPSEPVRLYGDMAVQVFAEGSPALGALVSSGPGRSFTLTEAQWGSYHQIGGKSGDEAASIAGPVLGMRRRPGLDELVLGSGVLDGRGPDQPHFFIPAAERSLVAHTPQLGSVTSNVRFHAGALEQEFEHGYVTLDSSGGLKIVRVAHPAHELPPGPLDHHILRSPDGTSWFVDDAGTRHWIPYGQEYTCLGGDSIRVGGDSVPSYAIATLPLGPPTDCTGRWQTAQG